MTEPTDYTESLKTERLNELAFSFKKTGALVLALELELFTLIDQGHNSTTALADALELDEEMVERLLTACKALELIREVDARLENFSDVSRYLVKSKPTYFRWLLDLSTDLGVRQLQKPRPALCQTDRTTTGQGKLCNDDGRCRRDSGEQSPGHGGPKRLRLVCRQGAKSAHHLLCLVRLRSHRTFEPCTGLRSDLRRPERHVAGPHRQAGTTRAT